METIKYILESKVLHLNLGDFRSFVTVGKSIKIINVTKSWASFADPEQLEAGVLKDIRDCKNVWSKMLATTADWGKRDLFLRCFDLEFEE